MDIILASQSPRRKELLALLGVNFRVVVKEVDERLDPSRPLEEELKNLAIKKASGVAQENPDSTVIGADTVVVWNGTVLGKPKDAEEAFRMLQSLSGRTHQVFTAVAILSPEKTEAFCTETRVTFHPLTEEEIRVYIQTGEPMDKAGAYGIQGHGAKFIAEIHGDYYAVMGFPVSLVYQKSKEWNG